MMRPKTPMEEEFFTKYYIPMYKLSDYNIHFIKPD